MHRVQTGLLSIALGFTLMSSCARSASEEGSEGQSGRSIERLEAQRALASAEQGTQRAAPASLAAEEASSAYVRRSCGVCYAHNWQSLGADGYGSDTSAASLQELVALGVTALSYTDFGWMRSVRSTTIRSSTSMPGAETMQRMRDDIAQADTLGLMTMLKPHIWIGRGEWRGDIAPSGGDWTTWFASYRDFLIPRAEFAESVGAEWFVIGVELVSATRGHDAEWRSLIAEVRSAYSGKLSYAANWDEVQHVAFWDALDAIGVQMFAPLVGPNEPATLETMTAGAQRWLTEYEGIAERENRPLILTEAGVLNRAEGARTPWVWPEAADTAATAAGDAEQALYYRAMVNTFGQSEHVEQIYWWKWFTNPATNEEGPVGFSPRGKPAEAVLRDACALR
ncbi:MAG: hypothetical protein ACI82G_000459 [Bradymonadia bacterium]|jgi:hypothetical protein